MAIAAMILIGWPAMLTSLCLMAWSISTSRPTTAVAAALLGTPFLLYVSLSPRFTYMAPLALCAYYAAPVAIGYCRRALAVVCIAPFVALVFTVIGFVIRSRVAVSPPW